MALNGGSYGEGLAGDGTGNLYFSNNSAGVFGFGDIRRIDRSGKETVLYSFTGGADGGMLSGPLLLDSAGNLYGATSLANAAQVGSVFRLATTNTLTVLHSFAPPGDGSGPLGVSADGKGNLWGTVPSSYGFQLPQMIYKWNAANGLSIPYRFTGGVNGDKLSGGLIPDAAGNVYGTMSTYSPSNVNHGAVLRLDSTGNSTILYRFKGGADGGGPTGTLTGDAAGYLYGTTSFGGAHGQGVIYRVDLAGNETVLYNFAGGNVGVPLVR